MIRPCLNVFMSILHTFLVVSSLGTIMAINEGLLEDALFQPLANGDTLARFSFGMSAYQPMRHLITFPRVIANMVTNPAESYPLSVFVVHTNVFVLTKVHYSDVKSMEVTFTQGLWDIELWGPSLGDRETTAKPPGLEISAEFSVPPSQVRYLFQRTIPFI